jgi:hypothetical protein
MKGPEAPNPYETAAAQGAANLQTAIGSSVLSNINEVSPYGSVNYAKSGTETVKDPTDPKGKRTIQVPRYTRTTTLSPDQQALLDQQNLAGKGVNELAISQIDRLKTSLGEPFNLDGLPERTTDWSADRQRVEDAIMSRLNPQFERDEEATRTRLQNQGLTVGSEIYNNELEKLGQAKTDARMQAILAGGDEQSRLAALSADTRNAALQERLAVRNQPINEISTLLGGGQVTVPQFAAPSGASVGQVPIGQYIQDDYANRSANYQNQMSGLFGLGGTLGSAAIGLSDKRAKKDIKPTGLFAAAGIPIKTFKYKAGGPRQVGVIAQDAERKMPSAVMRRPDGMRVVDYAQVMGR